MRVLIVTDLAARGLDIPFINNIIHFDFPQSTKNFIHRCGRTARAGRDGRVFSFICVNELMYINEILLYAGRKLSNNFLDLGDNSKAFFGSIPSDLLYDD